VDSRKVDDSSNAKIKRISANFGKTFIPNPFQAVPSPPGQATGLLVIVTQ